MDPAVIGVFIPLFAIVGGFGLVALKMWSGHKVKLRELDNGGGEQFSELVNQLTDEVSSMREEITELQEQADFTERILTEARSKNALGPGD